LVDAAADGQSLWTNKAKYQSSYFYLLRVRDVLNPNVFDISNVNFSITAIPKISISGNTTICLGASTIFTASGGSSYVWTPITNLNNPWLSNPTASPNTNTTYTVSSVVNGCQGSASINLNVINTPAIAPVLNNFRRYCLNKSADVLPNTSSNGITGT
jgi:hypothetical protein